jgi:hypothetical protein
MTRPFTPPPIFNGVSLYLAVFAILSAAAALAQEIGVGHPSTKNPAVWGRAGAVFQQKSGFLRSASVDQLVRPPLTTPHLPGGIMPLHDQR